MLTEMPEAEPLKDEHVPTDPANWPSVLTDSSQVQLVCKGPSTAASDFVLPRNAATIFLFFFFFKETR